MSKEQTPATLPMQWVERIFHKLTLIYGRDFTRRWDGMPLEEVKQDWAEELGRFAGQGEAIRYALEHVPDDRPPTVRAFARLCDVWVARQHMKRAQAFMAMGKLDEAGKSLDKAGEVLAAPPGKPVLREVAA